MPQNELTKDLTSRIPTSASTHTTGKNYLYIIGIDAYKACPPLFNCVRDATQLTEVLHEKYQFDKAHTFTLFNKEATERNIFQTFRELAETVTPKDNLIIYYSGHGEYDKVIDEGYWIPVDAQLGAQEDYIANGKIKTFLNAIPTHHTFLIVDSCFSGSLFTQFKNTALAHRLEKDPSRWGLTAGRNEIVSDGKAGNNSPFADMLLYQLRNETGPIGVASICNKVIENVIANADQTPRGEPLKIKGHRGGQFFFHPKNATTITPNVETIKSEEIIPKSITTGTPTIPSISNKSPANKSATKFALLGLLLMSMLGGLLFYFERDIAPTEAIVVPRSTINNPATLPSKQKKEPIKGTSKEKLSEKTANKTPTLPSKSSRQNQNQAPIRPSKDSPNLQQAPTQSSKQKLQLVKQSVNGKYGLKDQKTGQWVLLPNYKNITAFSGTLAAVQDFNYKWGYVNTKGEVIIPFLIDQPSKFASSQWIGVMINGKMIEINKKGQVRMGKRLVSLTEFVK